VGGGEGVSAGRGEERRERIQKNTRRRLLTFWERVGRGRGRLERLSAGCYDDSETQVFVGVCFGGVRE
jgi:hypothetical protein